MPIVIKAVLVTAAFSPLLRGAFVDVGGYVWGERRGISVGHEIAVLGYPLFAMLGSAAVAPWFWPLSVPVAISAIVLVVAIWRSAGRRWLVYVVLAMLAMEAARVFDVKRVLIFLPWLFLALAIALLLVKRHDTCARRAMQLS